MKKSDELYLSAREAAAELAISPATLYAYVSRGLIRSEPSPDSRSHRYRAEDIRGLKERRVPSPEPRGFRNFDADLPVMDSAIATITEQGPIYRGVNCVDLSLRDTLEHTATLLWDVTGVDPFASDNCPHVSDEMRAIAEAARSGDAMTRFAANVDLHFEAKKRGIKGLEYGGRKWDMRSGNGPVTLGPATWSAWLAEREREERFGANADLARAEEHERVRLGVS